jgi:6-phosphogluconate dehydrogenase
MVPSQIGIYGLGVMGRNLALNFESKGLQVSVYNRRVPGEDHIAEQFMQSEGKGKQIFNAPDLPAFVESLEKPARILLMVKAGPSVDEVISELIPFMRRNDILIDGGNSHYADTERRMNSLLTDGLRYVGMGVSGGEEGARLGPSLMPGGDPEAWKDLKEILQPIAAESSDGKPCCNWIGRGGSGHFVKMVHNGIEYADMQILAEAYHIMSAGLKMSESSIADQFRTWNNGLLQSYLTEITADIFAATDEDGTPLIRKILDSAGQKGTGKWTAISALETGRPMPGITQAVFARFLSSLTGLRSRLSDTLPGPDTTIAGESDTVLTDLHDALLASRIICYAEGFYHITESGKEHDWNIDPGNVAALWQGGCIIRSRLLKPIVSSFEENPGLPHLLSSGEIASQLKPLQQGWRQTVSRAISGGIPVPVISASIAQYDSLRSARLPASLIQAQRDYFGAHTFERTDYPRGEFFHHIWTKS